MRRSAHCYTHIFVTVVPAPLHVTPQYPLSGQQPHGSVFEHPLPLPVQPAPPVEFQKCPHAAHWSAARFADAPVQFNSGCGGGVGGGVGSGVGGGVGGGVGIGVALHVALQLAAVCVPLSSAAHMPVVWLQLNICGVGGGVG